MSANAAPQVPVSATSLWHSYKTSVIFMSPEYLLPGAETTTYFLSLSLSIILLTRFITLPSAMDVPPNLQTLIAIT